MIGIYQYYVSPSINIRILSLGEVNSTAQALSYILALLTGLSLTLRFQNIFYPIIFCITGLTAFTMVLTYSRTMWVALMLMPIIFLLVRRDRRVAILFVVISISVYAGATFSDRFRADILSIRDPLDQPTITERFMIWEESFQIIKDRPLLGIGLKTYGLDKVEKKYHLSYPNHAHSMFINVASELGLLGVLALCLWLAYLFRTLFKIYKKMKSDLNQGLWLGGLGCFIILLVAGLADPMLGSESSLFLMTVLGLMMAGYRIENGVPGMTENMMMNSSEKISSVTILQRVRSRLVTTL